MTLTFRDLTDEQLQGARFMASRPVSMLADVPGLGKTAQLAHAFDISGAETGLVICPPILRDNIDREFRQWTLTGRTVHVIRSGNEDIPPRGLCAVSYHLAATPDMQRRLHKRGGDFLACDEAHALKSFKNRKGGFGFAVLSANGIARTHERMAWLTGTPMPNHAGELYAFCKAAGVWQGNRSAFISAFCNTVETPFGVKILGNKNTPLLKQLIAPVFMRRTEIRGLPDKRVNVLPVTGDARALNSALAALSPDVRAALEDADARDDFQFYDTPAIATIRRLVGLAKAPGVGDLIATELDGGEPSIVAFGYHPAVLDLVREPSERAGFKCATLDGRTPEKARQGIIDAFQHGEIRLLVCQLTSASEGITLTASSRVVMSEPSWTPKENEQAIARCWRKGQKQTVRVSYAALAQSLDQRIMQAVERKSKNIAEIMA